MKKFLLIPALFSLMIGFAQADDSWLPTLKTDTPEQGFQLAIKLSRMGVKTTQPNVEILKKGRADYATDAEDLIQVSHVIATHFATVAAANNYWK
ncbi:MAG: hexameric tyrosine-coordinated heme protein [Thiopseudomonas sp.]|nr:peroxidase [Gammaproteobacteria bacterium]